MTNLPSAGRWLTSHLSSTWRWAERIERIERIFFQLKIPGTQKKRDILNWKAGKRDCAKKACVYARNCKSGNVDTYS